jgi:hypothetical protein
MVEKNGPLTPFLIVLATVSLLGIGMFLPVDTPFFGLTLKKYDLLADLITAPPSPIKKISKPLSPNPAKNKKEPALFVEKADPGMLQDFSKDSIGGLRHFFQSLSSTKASGKKTRVAYFGDSMIEGDILTQDLRNNLQNTFGGFGVGFVPITSNTAGFRQSIHQAFSDNWTTASLIMNSNPAKPLGISGFVFSPNFKKDSSAIQESSWVSFSPCPNFKHLERFYSADLFYGASTTGNNYIHAKIDGKMQKLPLQGSAMVNKLILNDSLPFKNISISFNCANPINIYGASFESKTGVFLDNISFRGNSGLPLTKMNYPVLQGFNHYLNYDLIILHYGLNVANSQMKDYSWYQVGMVRVVDYLKACFPQASFLLISVSDKSYKNGMVYETDPSIPLLVEAQRKVAEKTGVAFWNLYEGMGGHNSMLAWVDTLVPLANKDYTHLNFKGGKKVADLLFERLMQEYKHYETSQKFH